MDDPQVETDPDQNRQIAQGAEDQQMLLVTGQDDVLGAAHEGLHQGHQAEQTDEQ